MTEWVVTTQSMIPQGELAEALLIAKVDRMAGTAEIMRATMEKTSLDGTYLRHDRDSPFISFGVAAMGEHNSIDALLQAVMDCAWKRGLRPKKFDPSAGELAAVKAHLEDMRRLTYGQPQAPINIGQGASGAQLGSQGLSDIDPDPNKSW